MRVALVVGCWIWIVLASVVAAQEEELSLAPEVIEVDVPEEGEIERLMQQLQEGARQLEQRLEAERGGADILQAETEAALEENPGIREAMQTLDRGEEPPILYEATRRRVAFGYEHPELRCAPEYACDIELKPGEEVTGVAVGDPERWIVEPLDSGSALGARSHVIVRPVDFDQTSNLVIGTSERTYHLRLVSPPKASKLEVVQHLAFYYPGELQRSGRVSTERARALADLEGMRERLQAPRGEGLAQPLDRLHFGYSVARGSRQAFAPTTVYDDGERTVVRLPSGLATLPSVLVKSGGGEARVPNFRFQGSSLVIQGIFEEIELFTGVGRKRRTVRVERTSP